jgi:hypothetical protein
LADELGANFTTFETRWTKELTDALGALGNEQVFKDAFGRLVSLQAWRSELLEEKLAGGSLQFALEGQNDLLVSYILARGGQWRSSLQAQRAALENYLCAIYFKDHPIELELWSLGKYKPSFSDLLAYIKALPTNIGKDVRTFGYDIIKSEYAVLSKAVHGSAVAFRMATDQGPEFFSVDVVKMRQWHARLRQVIRGLNLLLLAIYADDLAASRKRGLRKGMTYALKKGDKAWVKTAYQVTLPFK